MSDSIETSENMAQPWTPTPSDGAELGSTSIPGFEAAWSRAERRSGIADWTKTGTGVDSPASPTQASHTTSTGSVGSNPTAASPQVAIAPPGILTQSERRVIALLVDVVRSAFFALDNSEEMQGDDGERCHCIDAPAFDSLQELLDDLVDLPDEMPDTPFGPGGAAEWALRRLLDDQQITLSPAAVAILLERQRQVTEEGWTAAHDDEHFDESLALAAAWYATPHYTRQALDVNDMGLWPTSWDPACWRPSPGDRWRDLEKAGGLILAEMERRLRAGQGPLTSPAQPTNPKGTP